MPYLEAAVICAAALAALCVGRVVWSIGKYTGIAYLTKLHGGRAISDKYPPEWVKYHRENGGW